MSSKIILSTLATVFCALPLGADQHATLNHSPSGCSFNWQGQAGRNYFVQWSTDLENWMFIPTIRTGNNAGMSEGIACSSSKFFVQLRWSDLPDEGDPNTADFDGDGISNLEELQAMPQTSPLDLDSDSDGISDAGLIDDDGDGIPTGWEIANGYDPLAPDPMTVLQQYISSAATASTSFQVHTPIR